MGDQINRKDDTVQGYTASSNSSRDFEKAAGALSQEIRNSKEQVVDIKASNLGDEPSYALSSLWKRGVKQDPSAIATQPSVFDDPEQAPCYQPHSKYENLHRFDPAERWTWAEERKVVWKIDWRVTAWAAIAFFALDLDRSNLSQANTDNFLEDMNLSTNGMAAVAVVSAQNGLTAI